MCKKGKECLHVKTMGKGFELSFDMDAFPRSTPQINIYFREYFGANLRKLFLRK